MTRIEPCKCCTDNVRVRKSGYCAECETHNADLRARVSELETAGIWLVNLAHNIGKAGGPPEPGEWEAAYSAMKDALSGRGKDGEE